MSKFTRHLVYTEIEIHRSTLFPSPNIKLGGECKRVPCASLFNSTKNHFAFNPPLYTRFEAYFPDLQEKAILADKP